jgi:hypothetical protein
MASKLAQTEIMEARAGSEKAKGEAEIFEKGLKGIALIEEMQQPAGAAK